MSSQVSTRRAGPTRKHFDSERLIDKSKQGTHTERIPWFERPDLIQIASLGATQHNLDAGAVGYQIIGKGGGDVLLLFVIACGVDEVRHLMAGGCRVA